MKTTTVPGYNPMKWECEHKGCWKDKCSPNIEFFAGALPRKLAFSDIDGAAEVNGHFLFLEWKSHGGDIPTGQRIFFERLTKLSKNIAVVVVDGDPETMQTRQVKYVHDGIFSEWRPCDLEELHERIKRWSTKVDIHAVGGVAA